MSQDENDTVAETTAVLDGTVVSDDLLNIHEPDATPTRQFSLDQLAAMGFIVPVADPATLRAAFAYRAKMLAAILDPHHDFLYQVTYEERGKLVTKTTTNFDDAKKYCETYKVPYKAAPKKSGVTKLATAFGFEGKIIELRGLPLEPNATYSYCVYEVTHRASGRKEIGQGYYSRTERGQVSEHFAIAMADTRAHSRAVLRLAGFGEVGAEEIMAMETGGAAPPTVRIVPGPPQQARPQLSEHSTASAVAVPAAPSQRVPATAPQAPATAPQAPATARPVPSASVPIPLPSAPVIIEAQVGKLSKLLIAKRGSRDKAIEWLRQHAGCESTRQVREADYTRILSALEAMEDYTQS